ncbi:MAG: hypothetical protein CM15mP18_0900 [Methanobacteriota archaeon]|nr:MAG: hypothetical protein CM15mP18_0900 [Euryarchaeota archaeon]
MCLWPGGLGARTPFGVRANCSGFPPNFPVVEVVAFVEVRFPVRDWVPSTLTSPPGGSPFAQNPGPGVA